MTTKPGLPFIVIGLAFVAIGASGQRAFVGIGGAFLAIGLVLIMREKRASGPK